jgi:hypothetical protein
MAMILTSWCLHKDVSRKWLGREFSAQGIYSTGGGLVNAHIEEGTWVKGVRELSAVRRIFGPKRDEVTGE